MVDQMVRGESALSGGAARLDANALRRFIRHGFLTVQTSLPAAFHSEICQRAGVVLDTEGNWGNNILPRLPELQQVLEDPAVRGALSALLGPTYALHPHRYCHRNEPGSTAQRLHKDTREFSGDRHLRHHRPRWLIAFYYPQTVSSDMGPTAIVPRSPYYLEQPDQQHWPEKLLCAPAGTVAIVHFGMWHRATANRSAGSRFMFKFEFGRMDEPEPVEAGHPITPVVEDDDAPVLHHAMWANLERWIQARDGRVNGVSVPSSDEIPVLVDAMSDAYEPARLNATYSLAAAGASAVAPLRQLFCRSEGVTRRYAAFALTSIGEPAVETLLDLATDDDEQTRVNAIDALGDMGAPAAPAVAELNEALQADSPWVRRHAAEALGLLGAAALPAVPTLARSLNDQQPYVRMNAALALARIGPVAGEAVPALIGALQDADRYVRGWAAIALRRVGTPDALTGLIEELMVERWCPITTTENRY